jgi:hypothetical protein
MTIKAQIDSYLDTLLAGILQANGYRTDAGADVFRELEYTERPDVTPCLIIYRGEHTSGVEGDIPPGIGEANNFYPIGVEGFIDDTKDGAEGEKLRADIVRALRSDPLFGGLTEPLIDIKSSTSVQQGEEVFSCVQVAFTVFYVTAFGEE